MPEGTDLTNTELAILGLVAEKPKYGYELEQDIQQRGMREWTEIGFSSIYYILNKLEECGLLGSEKTTPGDRPARKIYHLTGQGWSAYSRAVRQRLAAPRPRSGDFDLGLANLPALPLAEVRAALQTYRASLGENVVRVRAKWQADRAAAAAGNVPFAPHVDVLFGHSIAMMEAELRWLDQTLNSLNGGSDDQA